MNLKPATASWAAHTQMTLKIRYKKEKITKILPTFIAGHRHLGN
jgi:hypothetical protein